MKKEILLIIVLILILAGCNKDNFELQSSAFKNGERIPDKYCY